MIILFLSAGFVFVRGGTIPYALFYLCLLIPCLSILHALLLRLQFRSGQRMSTMNIVKGQAVDYLFSAYNRGPLVSPRVTLDFFDSRGLCLTGKSAEISLLPWQRYQGAINLEFAYRGVYMLGMERARVMDLFSIFRLGIKPGENVSVVVFPRIIHLESFSLSRFSELQGGRHYRKSRDEALKDTRKYEYGDPMSRIHWNLTAQKSDLITKLYESESELDVVFLLDLSPVRAEDPLVCEDFIIEFCVAVVRFLLNNSRGVKLAYAAGRTIRVLEGDGAKDFDAFYSALSEAEFTSDIDIAGLSRAAGLSGYGVVLSAREPDSELLDNLAGMDGVDYYRLIAKEGGTKRQYENNGPVRVYDLLPGDDIKALLETAP